RRGNGTGSRAALRRAPRPGPRRTSPRVARRRPACSDGRSGGVAWSPGGGQAANRACPPRVGRATAAAAPRACGAGRAREVPPPEGPSARGRVRCRTIVAMSLRPLGRALRRLAGAFPVTARGIAVAALCAASLRVWGYGSLDLVVFALAVTGLSLLAISLVLVGGSG